VVDGTLGELVGKRLDRPTAHSIGKLFQKRLVGRPAWIDDCQAVATLKKSTGHNANTYRIDVSVPGQDDAPSAQTFPFANPGQEHPPDSPHSPRRSTSDEMGNEGKGGKDIPVNEVVSSNFKRAKAGWKGWL
jgi:hypothetical protein